MKKAYLVIDCGTTNLRVTLLDKTRAVLDTIKADGGVRNTAIDGHNGRLRAMLKDCIDKVLSAHGYTVADVERCVSYGMISSNMGLVEIPHLPAPVSTQALRDGVRSETFSDIAPFPIHFIPGVRNFAGEVTLDNFSQMDMMRGEEVEAVGLFKLLNPGAPALFVLPGSHNKFVLMDRGGGIQGCMTSISGELLDAVTHGTILADAVGRSFVSVEAYDSRMVCEGAWECAHSGLGRAAFAGRILYTLGGRDRAAIQSYLLGAMLALDMQAMQSFMKDEVDVHVYVAGKAPVQQAMCDVLAAMGVEGAQMVDGVVSARMGLAGALEIAF